MGLNLTYVTKLGLLKILEIICLLIAFSTYESILSPISIGRRNDINNYYLAITIIAFVFVVIWFAVNLLGFVKDINTLVLSTVHLVFGVLIFAPSCILAHGSSIWNGQHTAKASVAFGIISSLLIFVDAQFHHVVAANEPSGIPKTSGSVQNPATLS